MSGTQGIDTGIPGVRIDAHSLRPIVIDAELAALTLSTGDAGDRTVVLLARGEVRAAGELVAETRLHDPRNLRMRVLDADVICAAGDPQRAIARLRALLDEHAGTGVAPTTADAGVDAAAADSAANAAANVALDVAMIQHHLGLAYFGASDFHAAHTRFTLAHSLRERAGAPRYLIDSSRRSLAAAEARLSGS